MFVCLSSSSSSSNVLICPFAQWFKRWQQKIPPRWKQSFHLLTQNTHQPRQRSSLRSCRLQPHTVMTVFSRPLPTCPRARLPCRPGLPACHLIGCLGDCLRKCQSEAAVPGNDSVGKKKWHTKKEKNTKYLAATCQHVRVSLQHVSFGLERGFGAKVTPSVAKRTKNKCGNDKMKLYFYVPVWPAKRSIFVFVWQN